MMKRFNYFTQLGIVMIMLLGVFQDSNAQNISTKSLDPIFHNYKIVNIDSRTIHQNSRNNHFIEVTMPKPDGKGEWNVELHNSGIISDKYLSQFTTESGIENGEMTKAIPTTGHIVGDLSSSVSLTFNEGFVYGFIKDKSGYNYIEPLEYYDSSQSGSDLYVVYNEKDLKPTAPHTCGMTAAHNLTKDLKMQVEESGKGGSRVDECFEVDYAIANDFLMFQEFGSIAATENHAIGVTNNVQTNWDDEFADELQFIIVTQFTATSAATDPWTTSTNAGQLLNSFTNWGPGGFGVTHDVGSLWTDRNFSGSTIGIAWLSVVCTGSRYNCLQNFTSNPQTKRVLVSHELGHNFAATHDGGGSFTIMAPSVNSSTSWSANSVSQINSHVSSRWCLADCAGASSPPTADFSFVVIDNCTPGEVQFINESFGSGTLEYEWEFPGGSPAFSTDEDPFVTYNDAGTFNVTLTVTNTAGSDEETQFGIIDILPSPEANFAYAIDGTIVSFFNLSQNATSYSWDFGDGSTSVNSDPVHDFLDDGVYLVTLTASSECGSVTWDEVIVIANPPTAGFNVDVQEGCAELTVQYTSTSSNNTDDFIWSFEGGSPAISTEENPTVTYSEAGVFDVTLTVINETGEDLLNQTDFITVNDIPLSDFGYTIDDNVVTFTNFSEGADTFEWDFGDGNSSTDENPTHTYENDGDYEVTLTVSNECGDNSVSSTVSISLLPIASFQTEDPTIDCATFSIDFESTSTNNPDSFEWEFPGGTPATSNAANPTVSYAEAGVYDVTLTVSNANGTNSLTMPAYVEVLDEPTSGFSYSEDGLTVTFADQSVGADSYAWDFGDGNTSTDANPVNTYAAEGIYTIELTVTNQCGTNTSIQTINNYTPVSGNFSSDVTSGCANLVVQFNDMSSENVTEWLWTFDGGIPATSTEQNPVVTYETAGQYDVVLTVSHPESSETITLPNYVAVSDVPVTSFEFFEDLFEVDFTNTTVEGNTYEWDFGDGNTSTDENPTHTYSEEGEYDVTLTATNACGSTTSMATVTINALPTAGFDAQITSGCGPLTVQFNDGSSSNVTAWAWTFEGGNPATSNEQNPLVVYDSPGTYNVQLVVTSAAGTDMVVQDDYITVFGLPSATIEYDLEGPTLTADNIGDGGNSNTWVVDGNMISDDQLVYTFPENGTYTVELTTDNQCGSDVTSVEVVVNVYPEVIYDDLPIVVCVGEEVTLADNSMNADEKSWSIFGADPASSTEDSPTVIYDSEGIFTIILTVSNQYGESTKSFIDVVTVIGLPTGSFVGTQMENVVDFETTTTNTTSYLWDFGDGNTSTEANPSHTFTKNGSYEVSLTISNECGDFIFTETFIINSNSVTETELADVNIYPNPATSLLTIELENRDSDLIRMDVIGIDGQLVRTNSFKTSKYVLDVNDMTSGTYLIKLSSDQATYYKKIIVMK